MDSTKKTELRTALKAAMRQFKMASIAEEAGVSLNSLQQFSSKGVLGEDARARLSEWLQSCGFSAKSTTTIRDQLREELRTLLKLVNNPAFDNQFVIERFASLCEDYTNALARAKQVTEK